MRNKIKRYRGSAGAGPSSRPILSKETCRSDESLTVHPCSSNSSREPHDVSCIEANLQSTAQNAKSKVGLQQPARGSVVSGAVPLTACESRKDAESRNLKGIRTRSLSCASNGLITSGINKIFETKKSKSKTLAGRCRLERQAIRNRFVKADTLDKSNHANRPTVAQKSPKTSILRKYAASALKTKNFETSEFATQQANGECSLLFAEQQNPDVLDVAASKLRCSFSDAENTLASQSMAKNEIHVAEQNGEGFGKPTNVHLVRKPAAMSEEQRLFEALRPFKEDLSNKAKQYHMLKNARSHAYNTSFSRLIGAKLDSSYLSPAEKVEEENYEAILKIEGEKQKERFTTYFTEKHARLTAAYNGLSEAEGGNESMDQEDVNPWKFGGGFD